MNTLADEFLTDLGGENEIIQEKEETIQNEENEEEMELEIEKEKYENAKEISKLYESEKLKTLLEKISKAPKTKEFVGQIEADPEYLLLVEANSITVEVMEEIKKLFRFVKDYYGKQLPELESTIYNPTDYAKVVLKVKTETDLHKIDFSDILPPNLIMVMRLTPTSNRTPISSEDMHKVEEGCHLLLSLEDSRRKIVSFVESRMNIIAPNLTTLLGSAVAAKIMTAAGGLINLSKLSSSNIETLGTTRKNLSGFSSAIMKMPNGFLGETEFVKKSPSVLKRKAGRLLAGKVVLAARVDNFHEDSSGSTGSKFLEDIETKIDKALEPPPVKLGKPLAAPDDKPKKRRGGTRVRKIKQKYEMTDLRKQTNRVAFGMQEQEEIGLSGKTLGMIGRASGKVRLSAQDKGILKKNSKKFGITGATSGLSSSLAFTPVQGLELTNPDAAKAAAQKIKEANEKYFGTASTFARLQ